MDLGLVNKEERDSEPTEDQLQRYHMATELCEKMREMHPDAEFSVNGPFTLMTPEEFNNYVGLSKGDASLEGTLLGARSMDDNDDVDNDFDDNDDNDDDDDMGDDDDDDRRRKLRSQGGNWDAGQWSSPGKVHPNNNMDNARQRPQPGPVAPSPGPDPWGTPSARPFPRPTTNPGPGPVAPTTAPGPAPRPTSGPAPGPAPGPSDGSGVDWKAKGCVTAIRNQGQCGSCWAFATTAAIESAMCIKSGNGKCTDLSEQQVTSCDTRNGGCGGGVPAYAIDYVKQNGGLCSLEPYPYKAASKGQCNSGCQKVPISISKAVPVTGDESNLAKALDKQPVVVAVAAGNNAWKQYKGGVLSGCDTNNIDHAVLAYGYTNDAWLIKNSWGTSWGEQGMIKLKRGAGGKGCCGIMSQAVYPELA